MPSEFTTVSSALLITSYEESTREKIQAIRWLDQRNAAQKAADERLRRVDELTAAINRWRLTAFGLGLFAICVALGK